jgi:uncharacterized membrane protein YfcA
MYPYLGAGIAGLCAGALNGLFGAGGGLVLVPLMQLFTHEDEQTLFSSSVVILFPVCIISLLLAGGWQDFDLLTALPYLIGSLAGGIAAAFWGKRIPTKWLHRTLGLLILWGGIRYLW